MGDVAGAPATLNWQRVAVMRVTEGVFARARVRASRGTRQLDAHQCTYRLVVARVVLGRSPGSVAPPMSDSAARVTALRPSKREARSGACASFGANPPHAEIQQRKAGDSPASRTIRHVDQEFIEPNQGARKLRVKRHASARWRPVATRPEVAYSPMRSDT